jgi:hypothetical protein
LRRQALWERLDQLVAAQPAKPLPAGPHVNPPEPDEPHDRLPDLGELIDRFGSYDKITPEAWAEHDRLMAEYQLARRTQPYQTPAKPKTYDPALGTCKCPCQPASEPVPRHEFRKHAITDEYVLVCTRCDALWDHKQSDEIISRICSGGRT